MSTINVNLFNYHKPSNSLSADISELETAGHKIGQQLTVKSYKTGNEINFRFDRVVMNANDEVTEWIYTPSDTISPIAKLVIWND